MIVIIDDDDGNDDDGDDGDNDAQVTGLVERMTSQAWAAERAQLVNDNLTSNEVAPPHICNCNCLNGQSWKENWRTKKDISRFLITEASSTQ